MQKREQRPLLPVSKRGQISPMQVEVASADSVLHVLDSYRKNLADLLRKTDVAEKTKESHCDINCECPPCISGDCSNCVVDRLKKTRQFGDPAIVDACNQYRGGKM
jgi:hypothetical protein